MTQVKNFSIGDRVRVTRSGHAHDQQVGIVQRIEPVGAYWIVKVYVRCLPFESRLAWHGSVFLSTVKK